jgi:predicted Zn-dependent protease
VNCWERIHLERSAFVLAAVLGAAPVAADGIYEPVPLKRQEPSDLIETSAQINAQFQRWSLLYGDPGVVDLVRRVGRDLAPQPGDDYVHYEFFVLRDPSPNAFALPNGHIYVHTGMLARLADESQLAGLLAHEITHVAGHHGVVQYRITAKKILVGVVLGALGSMLTELRFTRELEQEADDRAIPLLNASIYDPHAMPELMDLLAEDVEGLSPRLATIWNTHPDPEARAATSRALVADLPVRERHAADFDAIVIPLRTLTIRDYIQDDYPYTALALAQSLAQRYPAELELKQLVGDAWAALGPSPTLLPEDLRNRDKWRNVRQRVFKTRQERVNALLATEEGRQAFQVNMGNARSTYEQLLATNPEYAPAYRGLGEVYEALDAPRDAARAYLDYLKHAPQAPDRAVIVTRLAAIRDSLRGEQR